MALTWNTVVRDIVDTRRREWLYLGDLSDTPQYALHQPELRVRADTRYLGRRKIIQGVGDVEVRDEASIDRAYRISRRRNALGRDVADRAFGDTPTPAAPAAPAAPVATVATETPATAPEGYVSKADVLAEARRVARENGWCDDGLRASMGRLGIDETARRAPRRNPRHRVAVQVSVTVDGDRETARRAVETAARDSVRQLAPDGDGEVLLANVREV